MENDVTRLRFEADCAKYGCKRHTAPMADDTVVRAGVDLGVSSDIFVGRPTSPPLSSAAVRVFGQATPDAVPVRHPGINGFEYRPGVYEDEREHQRFVTDQQTRLAYCKASLHAERFMNDGGLEQEIPVPETPRGSIQCRINQEPAAATRRLSVSASPQTAHGWHNSRWSSSACC